MKAPGYVWFALLLGCAGSDALAQGGCMRGGPPATSMGSMMSSTFGSVNPSSYQTALLAQAQLAYQYQLQQTQLQQQLQLEQAALKLQSEQAARKDALREQRLAARRERQESQKARRIAERANAKANTTSGQKQLAATK